MFSVYVYKQSDKTHYSDQKKEMILDAIIQSVKNSGVRCSHVLIRGDIPQEDWFKVLDHVCKKIKKKSKSS